MRTDLESQTPVPAPAPDAPTDTISATRDAAAKGDFAAFDAAEQASRRGTPLARVEATPAPDAAPSDSAPAPERTISKRQQEINDRAQRAVESATAALRDEVAQLRAQLAQPRPTQPDAPAPVPAVPDWKRIAGMPEAPKLEDFDSVPEHTAAMALFVNRVLTHEQAQRQEQDSLTAAQRGRVDRFVQQLTDTKTADPTFVAKLTPDVKALVPFAGLKPGEAGGPLNVVAEQVYDSPIAPQVLLHFSEHPEALQRFAQVPPSIASLPPAARTGAHIQWIVREFGKLEASLEGSASAAPASPVAASPVSTAPPPAPVLTRTGSSTDPKAAAMARGDFSTWDKLELAERMAKRQGR